MSRRQSDNARRFRRLTLRILVDYSSPTGHRCDYATTLGAGGLFVETDEMIPPGTTLKLRFRLPEGETLHEIEGRVCWQRADAAGAVEAPGMGIQFTDSFGCAQLARELEDLQL